MHTGAAVRTYSKLYRPRKGRKTLSYQDARGHTGGMIRQLSIRAQGGSQPSRPLPITIQRGGGRNHQDSQPSGYNVGGVARGTRAALVHEGISAATVLGRGRRLSVPPSIVHTINSRI